MLESLTRRGRLRRAALFFIALGAACLVAFPAVANVLAKPTSTVEGKFYFNNDRGCDGSWAAELLYQNPQFSGPLNPPVLVVLTDAVVNGAAFQPAWADDSPDLFALPANAFWDGAQPTGAALYQWIDDLNTAFVDTNFIRAYARTGGDATFDSNWSGKIQEFELKSRASDPTPRWELVATSNITAPAAPKCAIVHIKKVTFGERADPAQVFTADVNRNFALQRTLGVPFSETGPNAHAIKESEDAGLNGNTFTVDEHVPANWALRAWQVLEGDAECPAASDAIGTGPGVFGEDAKWYGLGDSQFGEAGATPVYNIRTGFSATVCFLNEYIAPRGDLRIEKYLDLDGDGVASGPGEGLIEWSVSVVGPGLAGGLLLNDSPGVKTIPGLFAGDSYTITEQTLASYRVTNASVGGFSQGPTAVVAATIPEGETVVVRFFNQPLGALRVEKYLDFDGDGDAADPGEGLIPWAVDIAGPGLGGSHQLANGFVLFEGLGAGGQYDVTEASMPGYHVTRATVNGVAQGALTSVQDVPVPAFGTAVVRFYNQPRGGIRVHKSTWNVLNNIETQNPGDDDGWTIRVTSAACRIDTSALTDAQGNATFDGLPMCADYAVSEDLAVPGASGYSAVAPASVTSVQPTLAGFTVVNFTNETRASTPACSNCSPTFTAPVVQPSPVPQPNPTPSAGQPGATPPVAPSVQPATPVPPSPVTGVAGERTPGAATPIAPSTGSSPNPGQPRAVHLSLLLAGLLAAAGGFRLVGAARSSHK